MSYINIFFSKPAKQQQLPHMQDLYKIFSLFGGNSLKKKNQIFLFFFLNMGVTQTNRSIFLFLFFLQKTFNVTDVRLVNHSHTHLQQLGFLPKIVPFGGKVKTFFIFSTQRANLLSTGVVANFSKLLVLLPKHNSTSVDKFLSTDSINAVEFQFLRKNRVFNKGRYSRCRQNYRLGVYLCMYLSVVSIFGMYFWFYKFSFNFTYLWWLFIGFVGSFFLPKIIKYRLYEPNTLITKFYDLFLWASRIVGSLFR